MKHFNFNNFCISLSNHIIKTIQANTQFKPFFITKTFDNSKAYHLRYLSKYLFAQNERLYLHTQSRITNNYSRKHKLFIRSFDFFDVSNSDQTFYIDLDTPLNPHIHSIALVHDDTLEAFNDLIDEEFRSVIHYKMKRLEDDISFRASKPFFVRPFPALKTIDARAIKPDDIHQTLTYSAKLLKNYKAQKLSEEIQFYDFLPSADKCKYVPSTRKNNIYL